MMKDAPLSFAQDKPPSRNRFGKIVCVLVVVCALAGGAVLYWMNADPQTKDRVSATARQVADEAAQTASDVAQTVRQAADAVLPRDNAAKPEPEKPEPEKSGVSGVLAPLESTPLPPLLSSAEGPNDAPGEEVQGEASDADAAAPVPAVPGETAAQTPAAVADASGANASGANASGANASGANASGREGEGRAARGLFSASPDSAQAQPGLAGRTEDAVVRSAFIEDLAAWIVSGYVPGARGGRGRLNFGVQSANARYGVGMRGLAWIGDDLPAGRAEALRYVYTPGMLDALYRMYIEQFMQAMAAAAAAPRQDGGTLTPDQAAEMRRLCAGRLLALSGALQGVGTVADLRSAMADIRKATAEMLKANDFFMQHISIFDQARADNAATLDSARADMEKAHNAYQTAAQERDRLRGVLLDRIRANPEARQLGNDDLLFVTEWVARRLQQSDDALAATRQAAALLLDLSRRLDAVQTP
jgi:hypothetical protein